MSVKMGHKKINKRVWCHGFSRGGGTGHIYCGCEVVVHLDGKYFKVLVSYQGGRGGNLLVDDGLVDEESKTSPLNVNSKCQCGGVQQGPIQRELFFC